MGTAALEVAALRKRYPQVEALRDVSFAVAPGEILGYLGPNGAGKTTTLRIAIGLVWPDAGVARLFGAPASRPSARRRAGYLPGDLRLDGELTGRDLLDHHARMRGPRGAALRDATLEVLELATSDLARRLRHLSHGTRQKVGLALALQHDPDLIVLDEPTNGLDPIVQRRLRAHLRACAGRGAAVLFSSHVLSEVEALCDRVAVIRRGRLVALEPVEALRARAPREAQVRFTGAVPDGLDRVPGVARVSAEGDRATLAIRGDVRPLLARLAAEPVADLVIPEPSLETLLAGWLGEEGGDA
jgi:ABC-2 type transport system ATP-binding protein